MVRISASSVRHHIRTNHVIASISVMFMKGATMSRTKDRLHSFRISRPSEIGLASISDGALTADDRADPRHRAAVAQRALATGDRTSLRYRRHYFMAQG